MAFRFLGTRILGIPIPFHQDFDEVNLRFYVRRDTATERRRGVVFIREIAPRRAVAAVARLLYDESYITLPMRSVIQPDPIWALSYTWHHGGRWHALSAQAVRPSTRPDEGSLEQFIVEHYWGYTRQRNGATLEYQVTHPPWMVAPADSHRIDADLGAVYKHFASALRQPTSVFLADGSAVAVSSPCPVSPDAAP